MNRVFQGAPPAEMPIVHIIFLHGGSESRRDSIAYWTEQAEMLGFSVEVKGPTIRITKK